MEKSHLGFKQEGSWADIVEFGEKIYVAAKRSTDSLDIDSVEDEPLSALIEEFEDWRPKHTETKDDVSERTAENASIDPPSTEKIEERVDEAGGNAKKGIEAVEEGNAVEAGSEIKNSLKQLSKSGYGLAGRLLESAEEFVYNNVMTTISPYYFDNRLMSVCLSKKRDGTYVLEVNPNHDKFRKVFSETLEDISEKRRWHSEFPGDDSPGEHTTAESIEEFTSKRTKESESPD